MTFSCCLVWLKAVFHKANFKTQIHFSLCKFKQGSFVPSLKPVREKKVKTRQVVKTKTAFTPDGKIYLKQWMEILLDVALELLSHSFRILIEETRWHVKVSLRILFDEIQTLKYKLIIQVCGHIDLQAILQLYRLIH